MATIRLLVFLGTAVATIWLAYLGTPIAWGVLGVGLFVFVWLVQLHIRQEAEVRFLSLMVQINQEEQAALTGDTSAFDYGEDMEDPQHPYASDLDIFSAGGIFPFINRTATENGRYALAGDLKTALPGMAAIEERQEAIRELQDEVDWRQEFRAHALDTGERSGDMKRLVRWMETPVNIANGNFWRIIIYAFITVNLGLTVVSIGGWLPAKLLLFSLLISLGVVGTFIRKVTVEQNLATRASKLFRNYIRLFTAIEDSSFKAKAISTLREQLAYEGNPASQHLKGLTGIIDAIDQRNNVMVGVVLNAFFLWDLLQMRRLDKWKTEFSGKPEAWLEVVAQMETLLSFANLAYNNPAMTWPKPSNDGTVIAIKDGGHPLLPAEQRVNNDLKVADGHFFILTGANMAGKSTFLRTAGINLVLAMAGGPVAASEMTFSRVQVMSSMRTADSIQKSSSYFHSELARLSLIVKEIETKNAPGYFVILDEILKGTNSKDQQAGSKAFMQRLLNLGASGLIATHDLSLCEMADKHPDKVANACFEVEILDNDMHFDYSIREGICNTMNATWLMEKMGIS